MSTFNLVDNIIGSFHEMDNMSTTNPDNNIISFPKWITHLHNPIRGNNITISPNRITCLLPTQLTTLLAYTKWITCQLPT